jgi:polysaccharide biosynthesis/export protein
MPHLRGDAISPTVKSAMKSRRRTRSSVVGAGLFIVAALMGRAAAEPAAEPMATESVYRLAPGDRVNITVFDQAELSGEFSIDGSGNIRMALIGDVPIADLSIKEIEQQIAKRLGAGFLQNPVVSARISEFRPILVSGDVKTPGSYPFRYGTMAMSAVALAGGYAATEQMEGAARVEFLMSDERLRVLEDSRRVLNVRIARLEAQLSGATSLEIADAGGNDKAFATLLARERAIMADQIGARQRESALLREQRPRLESQIVSVQQQRDAEITQLKLIQEHLVDYNSLLNNGLARRYTGIELQREEARNKGNIAGFEAQMVNLQLAIGEIEVRVQQAESIYRQRVATELQEAGSKLREIETTIPVAREIRNARLQQGGLTLAQASANPAHRIVILRYRRNLLQTIDAAETTLVEPGDVVDVKKSGARDQPGAAAAAEAPDGGAANASPFTAMAADSAIH